MSHNNKKKKRSATTQNTGTSNSARQSATSSNSSSSSIPRVRADAQDSAAILANTLARSLQAMPALGPFLANLPASDLPEFMNNVAATVRNMDQGGASSRWRQASRTLDARKDGAGIDLVELTDRIWPDPVTVHNRLSIIHNHTVMNDVPRQIQEGAAARGKGGMKCEGPGCNKRNPDPREGLLRTNTGEEEKSTVPLLKRCAGCLQVSYCSTICQRQDWERHSSFCKAAQVILERGDLRKDTFTHLVKSVLSNPCLNVLLRSYARDVLDLTRNPSNGLRKNIQITCSFVEENVADLDNVPEAWVLQIKRVKVVDLDASTIDGLDVERELRRRASFFDNPAATNAYEQKQLDLYRRIPEGPRKDDIRDRMFVCNVPVVFTFQSDVEGATAPYSSMERLPWSLMLASPENPQPAFWLLQFNRTAREDMEDNLKTRMARPPV
ncbi:hypothetical protein EIP91_011858 [Steccherinum ochraceum]|uniref:MYND-type domain-containing protein n=1 Tax=Steccherinum ochraceum TaxID=92696 RepID=A0A4R0RHN6_9APHY|nr:hypothetical protein EIP91_011858 [Steccherinum ochraceum]